MISDLKGINAIDNKDDIEIQIDKNFYAENSKIIQNKIKSLELSFKIKFIDDTLPKNIYEFNNDLISKVKNNTKEILEKHKKEYVNIDKSYRRKIKKKLIENQV